MICPTVVAVSLLDPVLWATRAERVKKLIAIFEHVNTVGGAGAIVVGVLGNGASPLLLYRHPVYHGRIIRKSAAQFINTDLMPGRVTYVDLLLLGVFGIFCRSFEGELLFLLSMYIVRRSR